MKFAAWFCILIGILMLAQWIFFLSTGQVPELQTEPIAIIFHLVAEAVTALALMISGTALLLRRGWSRMAAFTSLGMLIYTVIVSPGYFAQQGVWPLAAMFLALLTLALVSLFMLARSKPI